MNHDNDTTRRQEGSLDERIFSSLSEFLRLEASSGILLLLAAVLAMITVNSPASGFYDALLDTPVEIRIGAFSIAKPLLLWINDGLMSIFFFLVGLELKRELLDGELSRPERVILPVIGAIGGMCVPALIYVGVNWGDEVALQGWAIPSATDIAFALGVLALLGDRVPISLKVFLMSLAIVDDLGAIIIIALFYTSGLSLSSLVIAGIAIVTLYLMNRRGVISLAPYILVGIVLWAAVLKSGVHATLAGVIVAMFIPFRKKAGESRTQVELLEHDLHPAVAYAILPIFAFANTGISFDGLTLETFTHTAPVGIAAGLFFGNQVGVLGLCWLAVKTGIAELPAQANWMHMWGISLLCGIGFTMSLFISSLAFEQSGLSIPVDDRLGILIGSIASGGLGYLVLRVTHR